MRVSWHAPLITNGSRIVGYVVTPHLSGTALTPRAYASPAIAATVAGFRVGQRYTFTVAAKNGYGVGAVLEAVEAVPRRVRRAADDVGQADIDGSPAGTTFCLSGVHNWTLRPKSGDRLVGPATLDGAPLDPVRDRGRADTNVVFPRSKSGTTRPPTNRARSHVRPGPSGRVRLDPDRPASARQRDQRRRRRREPRHATGR